MSCSSALPNGRANCLRSGDTLARQGGDEFTVLLPDLSSAEDAAFIAEKLLAELKLPFKIAGMDFFTTVSVGIALYPDDGENAELLIRNADIAMYQIKGRGKNGYLQFTPEMISGHNMRLSLENDLRLALESGGDQFELHYQPQGQPPRRPEPSAWKHSSAGTTRDSA
jgi:predicted signal transduction protein with EAL and GGDEF domain